MSISPQSGAKGSEDYHLLKYYNVQKRGSRFTLGLDAAANTRIISKNASNKNCGPLNSVQKSQWVYMFISP